MKPLICDSDRLLVAGNAISLPDERPISIGLQYALLAVFQLSYLHRCFDLKTVYDNMSANRTDSGLSDTDRLGTELQLRGLSA
jgi:hypothetical protein